MKSNKLQQLILEELQNYNTDELEEGWKDILPAAAIAAGTMFGGGAKAQAPKAPVQIQQQVADQIEVNLGAIFRSGRYKFAKEDKGVIVDKLKQIQAFINSHPNSDFQIEITSSESQVPNRDADAGTNAPMKKGELAQRRADSSKSMIEKFINNFKQSGQLKGKVNITTKNKIGNAVYKSGDNPGDERFTKDQFTNIIIKAVAPPNSIPKDTPKPTPIQQDDKFKGYNKINEPFYDDNNHLIGFVWKKSGERFGNSKQDTVGHYNTGRQDIIFQMTDDWGKDLGTYKAPMDWFNKFRSHPTTRHFSAKDIQQLKSGKFD